MCRIAGLFHEGQNSAEREHVIKDMCTLMQAGGPDAEGIQSIPNENLTLGHRRLSVIDLSEAAAQPLHFNKDRYVISYNGELYNFRELRLSLKAEGIRFHSDSDTEVILAAYSFWGAAAFEKFSGMFALAIWDAEQREIVLARDAMGMKPLYYACAEGVFAFASSVKALKRIKELDKPQQNWPVYFLAYGHLPEPVTTLSAVRPLPPGSFLRYSVREKKPVVREYRSFHFSEKISGRKEIIDTLRRTMDMSVKRHLISDVPVGVFLSGGLDSSIIALLARKYLPELHTNSITFEDSLYSEQPYQDLMIRQLGSRHQRHKVEEMEFHDSIPAILEAMDLPSCDGINTWFISKYARESGLKVVLSGLGADEIFGGYPSFKRMAMARTLQQMPGSALRMSRLSGVKALRRLCYLSIPGINGLYLFLRGLFTPEEIARELDASETEVWNLLKTPPEIKPDEKLSATNEASWMEINLFMKNQLLRDADVMSMAHGLEIRLPFLDVELLRFVHSINSKEKFSGKYPKQLLIDCYRNEIPELVWKRPKMGFTFPFREWFSDARYAHQGGDQAASACHRRMQVGKIHWSQFYTRWLMKHYA